MTQTEYQLQQRELEMDPLNVDPGHINAAIIVCLMNTMFQMNTSIENLGQLHWIKLETCMRLQVSATF